MGWLLFEALMGLGTSLVSLVDVVLDNCLAVDYFPTEQGSVCATSNTYCCTWINATGHVKLKLSKHTPKQSGFISLAGAMSPPLSAQQLRKPKVQLVPSLSTPFSGYCSSRL